MATKYSLKMLESCRVTPFINSSTFGVDELSLPFTYFDIRWLKFFPTEQIFFYQLTQNESTHIYFNSIILPKLKHSLVLNLTQFLPVAGNIIWSVDTMKPSILYTLNDGVSFIAVESNLDFNHLIKNEMQEATNLRPYIPELHVSSSKAAIIAFQITFFPAQGFSIGISSHHALLDGKSIAMFMKSWAHICKENFDMMSKKLLPPHLTPFFDRTVVDYPQEFDMLYLNNWLNSSSSDPNPKSLMPLGSKRNLEHLIRAGFEFSRQDINKLRQKVVSLLDEEDAKHMHLSSFVLSLAYTVVCIVNAKMVERKGKIIGLTFLADRRSLLDPPVPTNYIGNCTIACPMLIDAEAIIDSGGARIKVGRQGIMQLHHPNSPSLNGIAFVAKKISEKIKGLETRVKNMSSIEQEKEQILERRKAKESSDLFIGVAWSPKFEIYNGTNFGWGKPKKMQVISIDNNNSISMAESRIDNGGIEIGLVMERHEMEIFNSFFVNGLKDQGIRISGL